MAEYRDVWGMGPNGTPINRGLPTLAKPMAAYGRFFSVAKTPDLPDFVSGRLIFLLHIPGSSDLFHDDSVVRKQYPPWYLPDDLMAEIRTLGAVADPELFMKRYEDYRIDTLGSAGSADLIAIGSLMKRQQPELEWSEE